MPVLILLVGGIAVVGRLDRKAAASGVARVDVTRATLHHRDTWVDRTWEERIDRILLRTDRVDVRRPDQVEALVAELSSLSFVAEVGEVETIWPDGLSVPIRFRRPAACLKVGEDFYPVADDGTLLSGASHAPPRVDGVDLPVLGPHLAAHVEALPGDVLAEGALTDALEVAVSLRDHVGPNDRARLGRFLIDASRDTAFDGNPGGIELRLEGRHKVLWGRAPSGAGTGELPEAAKWLHVVEGLDALDAGEVWDLLDVRWDEAERHTNPDRDTGGGR